MPETKSKNYALRASIPAVLRYAGLGGAMVAIFAVVIGFYISGSKPEFRGKDFPGELSENVVGIIEKYNRKETERGVLKYHVRSDIAKTFDDNHQELDNVTLDLFKNGDPDKFDRISANRAIYLPAEDSKDFTVYFAGDVSITTSERLEVKTDQLNYRSGEEVARAEEAVSFSRSNISGKSFGAVVDIGNNTLELQRDVEFVVKGKGENGRGTNGVEVANVRAGNAFFKGDNEKVKLRNKVAISLSPTSASGLKQPAKINSNTAELDFVEREIRRIELIGGVLVRQFPAAGNANWMEARAQRAEAFVDQTVETLNLFGGVDLTTKRGAADPVNAKADSGSYVSETVTYELVGNVRIATRRDSLPFKAVASKAIYAENKGVVELTGAAEVSQGGDSVRGDVIRAELTKINRLKYAIADGSGIFRQRTGERETNISGDKLKAWFAENEQPTKAESRGSTVIEVVPVDQAEYSVFRLLAKKGIDVAFYANGAMRTMNTVGRTTLYLDAGSGRAAASEKTLTADVVTTVFRPDENELATARASGNAELVAVPTRESGGKFRTKIRAPRFDCSFFPGNNARSCESTKRSFVKRDAVRAQRRNQELEADILVTTFDQSSRSIRDFKASGDPRFSEGDRRAIAATITYSEPEELVRLRGGKPTVWDSRGRAKAEKIDWNTKEEVSDFSGGVSTTYFNQKQTGGSTPFTEGDAPVFLTAESARFNHRERTGLYIGNARAWQDDNYVRGDKILLEETTGRFYAEGNVSSVLYEAFRTTGGKRTREPVYVSASSLLFRNEERQLRYERNVDIRQGTDRVVGREADIFLDSNNSVKSSVVKGDVQITQPGKRASGDYARYDATSETVVIRGKPAAFSDAESGTSTGNVVTVDLKNNRVVNSGSSSVTGTGRIRSVYKVKKSRLN